MPSASIDIVIPIWNQPAETRNCLVNLINFTPGARLIMMDCGSERDTEKMLQEIADGLDEQALLMRDDSNIGFVKAANRGLARAEAPYIALLKNTSLVGQGWLEPLLAFASQRPDAGILQPRLSAGTVDARSPIEISSPSFSAMIITRELYRLTGGFDETMDGGAWCLRDFTRRACAEGYFTFMVPGPEICCRQEVQLGSERRREENLQRSMALFRERWGQGGSYVLHVPKDFEPAQLAGKFEVLLKGARHGNRFFVLLPAALHKSALKQGLDVLHEEIRLVQLPVLSTDGGKRRIYQRIVAENPGIVPVAAVDGIAFPWSGTFLHFSELCDKITSGYGTPHPPGQGQG